MRRWDHRTSSELRTTKGPAPFDSGVYSADLKLLASAPTPGAATIWNVGENRELAVAAALPRHEPTSSSSTSCALPRVKRCLTPKEFEDKYGWKNDPDKVRLIDR